MVFLNSSLYFVGLFLLGMCAFPSFFLSLILTHLSTFLGYIQEELARRRSKKPANAKKSKTNRGRFTSKYALSERLVCGNCGCYFRRVTWNIHGRKQIVWRCINRLEFGPKSCGNSPSLEETALHTAILEAICSLVHGQQEEMAAILHRIP